MSYSDVPSGTSRLGVTSCGISWLVTIELLGRQGADPSMP